MADDISELMSPGAISRVTRDLPARDQAESRSRRRPPRPAPVKSADAEPDAPPDGEPTVGSRLNVRA